MRFECFLSQADAIDRGINEYGNIKVELGVASLTQPQKDALKILISRGEIEVHGDNADDLLNIINAKATEFDKLMGLSDDDFFKSVESKIAGIVTFRRNYTEAILERYDAIANQRKSQSKEETSVEC